MFDPAIAQRDELDFAHRRESAAAMQERQQTAAQLRVELENRDARIAELEAQLMRLRAELAESEQTSARLRVEIREAGERAQRVTIEVAVALESYTVLVPTSTLIVYSLTIINCTALPYFRIMFDFL